MAGKTGMPRDEPLKMWDGVFGSFAEADGDTTVFEGEAWLAKICGRTRDALASSQGKCAIASVAETRDYALPYVAALAARRDRTLRILDFGGGMATSYFPLVEMLPPDQPLEYVIIENESVCEVGRELIRDDQRLRFRSDLPGPGDRCDILHCGSSLHYVDDWKGMIDRFAAIEPAYMLFADLPAADNQSFVTKQLFHGRRIPVHFWSLREFIQTVQEVGYDLLLKARFRGPYLDATAVLPTDHFDPAHRLTYCSQLVFHRSSAI